MKTLTIDIGGTGIKMIRLDTSGVALGERQRELTPQPANPQAVLKVIGSMLPTQRPFDRVSVGFPGVVVRGVAKTAHNLGDKAWRQFDLQAAIAELSGQPTRVINDADLQGFGVIKGSGVELVLTLGTGLGSALFVDGHLVPNLELGHHPLKRKRTYEDLVGNAELERVGKKKWNQRVQLAIATLAPLFNYDRLFVGGGNAKKLTGKLPPKVELFANVDGMEGGVALWETGSSALRL